MSLPTVCRKTQLPFLPAIALLAACRSMPPVEPSAPDLRLLQVAPLQIPSGCTVSGSFAISFTVATSGQTRNVQPGNAPECAREALIAWVESFRYLPPVRATPTAVEWMMVSARRGS